MTSVRSVERMDGISDVHRWALSVPFDDQPHGEEPRENFAAWLYPISNPIVEESNSANLLRS